MKRVIRFYHPEFNPIMELIEQESRLANWHNAEGMRVIAKSKFGVRITKLQGIWSRIYVEDEAKFAWLILKI